MNFFYQVNIMAKHLTVTHYNNISSAVLLRFTYGFMHFPSFCFGRLCCNTLRSRIEYTV